MHGLASWALLVLLTQSNDFWYRTGIWDKCSVVIDKHSWRQCSTQGEPGDWLTCMDTRCQARVIASVAVSGQRPFGLVVNR